MPKRKQFPQELLDKHPDLTKNEIKAIARLVLSSRANRVSRAYIVDFKIPNLGRFKSHGNKSVRRKKGVLRADKKRKRELQRRKELTKDYLLW